MSSTARCSTSGSNGFREPCLSLTAQMPPPIEILHGVEDGLIDIPEVQPQLSSSLGVVEPHLPAEMVPHVIPGSLCLEPGGKTCQRNTSGIVEANRRQLVPISPSVGS